MSSDKEPVVQETPLTTSVKLPDLFHPDKTYIYVPAVYRSKREDFWPKGYPRFTLKRLSPDFVKQVRDNEWRSVTSKRGQARSNILVGSKYLNTYREALQSWENWFRNGDNGELIENVFSLEAKETMVDPGLRDEIAKFALGEAEVEPDEVENLESGL